MISWVEFSLGTLCRTGYGDGTGLEWDERIARTKDTRVWRLVTQDMYISLGLNVSHLYRMA